MSTTACKLQRCRRSGRFAALAVASALAGGCGSGIIAGGANKYEFQSRAREVRGVEDLIGGPAAQAQPGDIVLENPFVKLIVQRVGAGPNAGAIIDADVRRLPLNQGYDRLGAIVPWVNMGRSIRATRIVISEDGRTTGRAVVDVFAEETRLADADVAGLTARLNPGDPDAALGDLDPDAAVPAEIRTRYILEPDSGAVLIETRYLPRGAETPLVYGDRVEVRGPHAQFLSAGAGLAGGDPAPGFGPFTGDEPGFNNTEFVAHVADELAYLYEPRAASTAPGEGDSACFATSSGVACAAGVTWNTASGPTNAGVLPAAATATEPVVHRRRFFVGTDLADASRARALTHGWPSLDLPVLVDSAGEPVPGAEAALMLRDGDIWRPWQHARADADGRATLHMPLGIEVRATAAAPGHPNAAGDGTPLQADVTLPLETAAVNPFTVSIPRSSQLEVFVRDHLRNPVPARVAVLGNDPSVARFGSGDGELRPLGAAGDVAVQPFVGAGDTPLPSGHGGTVPGVVDQTGAAVVADDIVALAAADVDGAAALALEPGTYTIVASRGPAYAASAFRVSLSAGDTERVLIDLPKVVDDLGWAHADLRVAASDDPRGRQSGAERVAAAAANGLHLVVAGDADFVSNDQSALESLGLAPWLDVAAGNVVDVPRLGTFAAFPVEASAVPQRSKPDPAVGEALDAPTLDGGAVDSRTGTALAAPDALFARLGARAEADAARLLMTPDHDASSYFRRIGLSLDTSAGYDDEAPTAGGIVASTDADALGLGGGEAYSDAWDALQAASGRHDTSLIWHNFNTAMRLWNMGRAAPVFAASDALAGWEPEPGTPRVIARLGSSAVDPDGSNVGARVGDAVRLGRDVNLTNGPMIDLLVRAVLYDNDANEVLDVYGPLRGGAHVDDMLFVRRGLYPGTDPDTSDFELRVTATVVVEAPLWAPLTRVELFRNASAPAHSPDGDAMGAFLSAVTAHAWVLDAADRAAAIEAASVRDEVDGAVTTTTAGQRYAFSLSRTFVLDDAELLAAGVPDQWIAARVVGDTSLYPVATGPAAGVPLAIANPVFIDLNNDAGASTFGVAFDGPCETPEADRPSPVDACVD